MDKSDPNYGFNPSIRKIAEGMIDMAIPFHAMNISYMTPRESDTFSQFYQEILMERYGEVPEMFYRGQSL